MLTEGSGRTVVIACNACRFSADARQGTDGRRGGTLMVEALRRVRDADATLSDIAVKEMPCLWACRNACMVYVTTPGKLSHLLGRFTPDDDAARAILALARGQADSVDGCVPIGNRPVGVRGHFVARIPPLDIAAE